MFKIDWHFGKLISITINSCKPMTCTEGSLIVMNFNMFTSIGKSDMTKERDSKSLGCRPLELLVWKTMNFNMFYPHWKEWQWILISHAKDRNTTFSLFCLFFLSSQKPVCISCLSTQIRFSTIPVLFNYQSLVLCPAIFAAQIKSFISSLWAIYNQLLLLLTPPSRKNMMSSSISEVEIPATVSLVIFMMLCAENKLKPLLITNS